MQFSCRGESIAPVQKMNGLGIDSCARLLVQVEFVINVYGRRNLFTVTEAAARKARSIQARGTGMRTQTSACWGNAPPVELSGELRVVI